jgi:hypothetical protein
MAVIRPNAEPPVTAVQAGDIFLIDGATGVRALAASQVPVLDANLNAAINSVVQGFTSTATAAGTTVLTAASTPTQYFTGSTTQTVTLPVTSTLKLNQSFTIQNTSTGAITVNSSGGNLVTTVAPGATATIKCIAITGTTAASWSAKYEAVLVASGKVLTVSNSLTLAGTDGTSFAFPTTSATLARTDAGQTFTGTQAFGALTATTLNGNTFTAGTGILTITAGKTLTTNNSLTLAGTDGKTLTVSNSLTLAGTDGTTLTFPGTSATLARTDAGQTFTGTQAFGALTATTLNGNAFTAGTGILTLAAAKTLTVSNTLTFAGTDASTLNVGVGGTLTGSSSAAVFYDNLPQNSQSTAYPTVLADAQKHILHPAADNNARTFTIAANASVAYPVGTTITFVNQINTVTIAITTDTLTLAGAGTTGSRTLAANGMATALKIAATSWIISGTGLS